MSSAYESATLLIRLYELRREVTMREARAWYARSFNPSTIDDVLQAVNGPNSAHFRMVTSYWEMAASFVNHGAIDEQMFVESNGEHLVIFAKIEPFLAEYRAKMGFPQVLDEPREAGHEIPRRARAARLDPRTLPSSRGHGDSEIETVGSFGRRFVRIVQKFGSFRGSFQIVRSDARTIRRFERSTIRTYGPNALPRAACARWAS